MCIILNPGDVLIGYRDIQDMLLRSTALTVFHIPRLAYSVSLKEEATVPVLLLGARSNAPPSKSKRYRDCQASVYYYFDIAQRADSNQVENVTS